MTSEQRLINIAQRFRSLANEVAVTRPEATDDLIARLTHVQEAIRRTTGLDIDRETGQSVLEEIDLLVEDIRSQNEDSRTRQVGYQAVREPIQNRRGAPAYSITKDQLKFLIGCGFTTVKMGTILNVSTSTVKRRLRQFELKLSDLYSDISDADLDTEVVDAIRGNSQIGPNAVRSRLVSNGIKVQRHRVRDSMLRVDPDGSSQRSLPGLLKRRTYSVAGPNSVWHIDGNHKLIRWRVVIHGGIDGFSRMLVFLRTSDNKRSDTVLQCFTDGIARYGVPSRTRCDLGGENNDVCLFMESFRGQDRSSAMRGKSTHNQRIERLWVDLWSGVNNLYHDLFHFMEDETMLDSSDDLHIWALHYVFLPRINRDLESFRNQWNNHGLRTEKHATPNQLCVQHMLARQNSDLEGVLDMFPATEQTAETTATGTALITTETADEQGANNVAAQEHESNTTWTDTVDVPRTAMPLSDTELQQLRDSVNPLDDTLDRFGLQLYTRTLEFLNEHVAR